MAPGESRTQRPTGRAPFCAARVADICETWRLHRVKSAGKNSKREEYSIVVETKPKLGAQAVQAEFKGWVDMREGRDKAKVSQVSRLDRYGDTSACVLGKNGGRRLKEYCLCKK